MREINLLPPHRRQSLQREVVAISLSRFLNSLIVAIGLVGGSGIVVIIGLWVYATSLSVASDAELEQTITTYQELRDGIASQNLFLTEVHAQAATRVVWSDFASSVLTVVPAGADVTGFSGLSPLSVGTATAEEEGVDETTEAPTFTLSGRAVARSVLTVFTDRLKGIKGVTAVEAPNSNLLHRENPEYTYTLKLDKALLRSNDQ